MKLTSAPIADMPPSGDRLTDYDRAHLKTYARLLDASGEGADWREVAALVLGLKVDVEPERAQRIHAAHLERARWVTTTGYRDLLGDHRLT